MSHQPSVTGRAHACTIAGEIKRRCRDRTCPRVLGSNQEGPSRALPMQYAILCYHDANVVCAWSKQEDEAVMAKLALIQERLAREGKLGPVVRLLPTTAATTLRKDRQAPVVIDGPFAETKEQLLGFYLVD